MSRVIIEKESGVIKEFSLLKKSIQPLKEKIKILVKTIKRRIFGMDGNYYYGSTAQNYERIRAKEKWWHAENQVVSDILKILPKGMSVLDIPFGTGRFLPLYAERQWKVTGLDVSHEMIDTAKDLREDLVKQCQLDIGDARSLLYKDDSFDVVLSFRFLDGTIMFKDQKKVLSELVRVTRKYLILEVFSVPDGNEAKLTVKKLIENQPVNGRLSNAERRMFLESFGLKAIKRIPAALEVGLRSMVYLCEKSN